MMFGIKRKLNRKQLADIGIAAAFRNGLKPISFTELDKCFGTGQLAVSLNDKGMLMMDPEFIRIEDEQDNVSYAYLTQRHIDEVRKAQRRVGSFTRIPAEMEVAFYNAEESMSKSGKGYWINPLYEEFNEINVEIFSD